jgi:hypothetical protein
MLLCVKPLKCCRCNQTLLRAEELKMQQPTPVPDKRNLCVRAKECCKLPYSDFRMTKIKKSRQIAGI